MVKLANIVLQFHMVISKRWKPNKVVNSVHKGGVAYNEKVATLSNPFLSDGVAHSTIPARATKDASHTAPVNRGKFASEKVAYQYGKFSNKSGISR